MADLLTGGDAVLRLPEIALDSPLSDIYVGVVFEAEEAASE